MGFKRPKASKRVMAVVVRKNEVVECDVDSTLCMKGIHLVCPKVSGDEGG
jgi:hypothetical protein